MNFADAHVEAWHEAPSDPNSTASGGAFFQRGVIHFDKISPDSSLDCLNIRDFVSLLVSESFLKLHQWLWNAVDDFGVNC